MQRHHILFTTAAVLLLGGIVLMTWREPGAQGHGDAEDGVAESSQDAQPHFWPGVLVFVAGLVLGGWTFQRSPRRRPSK